MPLLQAFTTWKAQEPNLQILEVEKLVHSDKYGYAGTVDAIGVRTVGDKAGIVILDWKTSNALYPEYAWQASAYAKAWEELTGQPVVDALIVRFDKYKPVFEAKQVHSIDDCFQCFLSCLALYNSRKMSHYKE